MSNNFNHQHFGPGGFGQSQPRANSQPPRPTFRSPSPQSPSPHIRRPFSSRGKPSPRQPWVRSPVPPPRWSPAFGPPPPMMSPPESFFQPILGSPLPFSPPYDSDGVLLKPSYDMELVYPPGVYTQQTHTINMTSTQEYWEENGGLTTAEIIAAQSQDYVDEKLAEYQATIQHLQDEQERVQKKTFTNWINSYLAKHIPPLHTVDLIEDLKDGTRLLALLSVLSGEKLPVEKGRNLRRPHFLSNCDTALQFLQSKRIKLVNINPSDIVDGKPAVVLGLVWTIILYFQIEENTRVLASLNYRLGTQTAPTPSPAQSDRPASRAQTASPSTVVSKHGRVTPSERWKQGARKALLQWVQGLMNKEFGLQVNDFGPSWRDGRAFLEILNNIKPGIVDMESLRHSSNKSRLEAAFRIGEELGVPRLLDAEDVDVTRPDEKSIMTYVAQFLHKANASTADNFGNIQTAFDDLLTWLNQKTQYMEHMKQTNGLSKNYRDYLALHEEKQGKKEVYNRLKTLVDSMRTVGVSEDGWAQLNMLWRKLESQLDEWRWLLDSSLPEPFGRIGEWLAHAELLLTTSDLPTVLDDEAARVFNTKIEQHKAYFAVLPNTMAEFSGALSLPVTNQIPPEQLNSMGIRLSQVASLAPKRLIHLKYLEHKCCLVAFIVLVENRVRQWTGPYGRNVQSLLNQFNTFVNRNQIFTEFDRAYADMKIVVEEYKREGGIDTRECRVADHFLWEIGERWKSVGMELRCVGSMLEEVISQWARYEATLPELESWLVQSLPMAQAPEDERMNYFQDIALWEEKFHVLRDTAAFLMATCTPEIASMVKSDFSRIEAGWNQLFNQVRQYQHVGRVLRKRKEITDGLSALSVWLDSAEKTVAEAAHPSELAPIQALLDSKDEEWRNVNRQFQVLIPELSGEEVERLMKFVKTEKERLVCLRSQIPVKLASLSGQLAEQDALRAGLEETSTWLRQAEELMHSYAPTDLKSTQETLLTHKRFFSKLVYYRSLLDSKRRLVENRHMDDQDQVHQLQQQFQNVERASHEWENKLGESLRCWRKYEESREIVNDCLRTVEKLMFDSEYKSVQTLESHKRYFEEISERPLKDLVDAAHGLRGCVGEPQFYESVIKSVEYTQTKWSKLLAQTPAHVAKLDFHLEKENLARILKEIHREVNDEEMLLSQHGSSQAVLDRNAQLLSGTLPIEARRSLDRLSQIYQNLEAQFPQDQSLKDALTEANAVFESLMERVQALGSTLRNIPQQWEDYRNKFNSVSNWMDTVDAALKQIMTMEPYDAQQFDIEKSKFLAICRDVDLKREVMKSLVKDLDLLVSLRGDEEALQEQTALENLIQRYKSLVPMIEVTMIRTETQSRCYTYREEIRRVCRELEGLDSSVLDHDLCPTSLEQVERMIAEQNQILAQLENQRPGIISLLQAGQDLRRHDGTTPEFVQTQSHELENMWRAIQQRANDKIKNLQEIHRVWTSFAEQKNSILGLLENTELQLEGLKSKDAASRLALNTVLHQSTNHTVARLKELSNSLASVSHPQQRGILEEEVSTIEQRLRHLLNILEGRISEASKQSQTYDSLASQIDSLRKDVEFCKAALLQLLQMEIRPDERLAKTQELGVQVGLHLGKLQALEMELGECLPLTPGDPVAASLSKELEDLRAGLTQVHAQMATQKANSEVALVSWTECRESVVKAVPFIEEGAAKVAKGFARPGSLEEAKRLKAEMKELSGAGKALAVTLDKSATKVGQVPGVASTVEEVETAQTKVASISTTADHWGEKYEGLVDNWEKYETAFKKLDDWATAQLQDLSTPVNYALLSTEQLAAQQAKLEDLCQKVTGEQANIASLGKQCDTLGRLTSAETAATLTADLRAMKGKISKLAEAAQADLNTLEQVRQTRANYNEKVAALKNWMKEFESKLDGVQPVFDCLEIASQALSSLSEELQLQQPQLTKVYEDVKVLTLRCPSPQVPLLSQEYSLLAQKFENLRSKVDSKVAQVEEWKGLHAIQADVSDTLQHAEQQLVLNQPADEAEVAALEAKLAEWKPRSKALAHAQGTLNQPLSAPTIVAQLETKLKAMKSQIHEKKEKANEVEAEWQKVRAVQQNLESNLAQSQTAVESILPQSLDLPGLQKALTQLQETATLTSLAQPQKAQLHSLAAELILKDPTALQAVQGILEAEDRKYERVSEAVKAQTASVSGAVQLWKEYEAEKKRLKAAVEEVENFAGEALQQIPTDEASALALQERLHKGVQLVEEKKPLIMSCSQLEAKLAHALDAISAGSGAVPSKPAQSAPLKQRLEIIAKDLAKKQAETETEALLWAGIQSCKTDVIEWLSRMYESLQGKDSCAVNPVAIKNELATYREELPHKLAIQTELAAKIDQLQALPGHAPTESLASIAELVEEGFSSTAGLVSNLEAKLAAFDTRVANLKDGAKSVQDKVSKFKTSIANCKDSIRPTSTASKFEQCRQLEVTGQGILEDVKQLLEKHVALKTEYPDWDDIPFERELANLKSSAEMLVAQAGAVKTTIVGGVERELGDKLSAAGRLVAGAKEKVKVAQSRISSPQEVATDLSSASYSCAEAKTLLDEVESELAPGQNFPQLKASYTQVLNDLKQVQTEIDKAQDHAEEVKQAQETFDVAATELDKIVGDIESKLRQVPERINLAEIESLQKAVEALPDISKVAPKLNQLNALAVALQKINPSSGAVRKAEAIAARNKAAAASIEEAKLRVRNLQSNIASFKDEMKKLASFVTESKEIIKPIQLAVQKATKPDSAMVASVAQVEGILKSTLPQTLLTKSTEKAEAILSHLSPESKEEIRLELKKGREEWDSLVDSGNAVIQNLEALRLTWASIDDSQAQVSKWLEEVKGKHLNVLQPTLQEKISELDRGKTLLQSVLAYAPVISILEQKINNLGDANESSKFQNFRTAYEKQRAAIEEMVKGLEEAVAEHEQYKKELDNVRHILQNATKNFEIAAQQPVLSLEHAQDKLQKLQQLTTGTETELGPSLDRCKESLQKVLNRTEPKGHDKLRANLNEVSNLQAKLFSDMKNATSVAEEQVGKMRELKNTVESLGSWIKDVETQVKDQSLKNSVEAKKDRVAKLVQLNQEVKSKAPQFENLAIQEPKDMKTKQLLSQYEVLKPALMAAEAKYKEHVEAHLNFENNYATFLETLEKNSKQLADLQSGKGKSKPLGEKRKILGTLVAAHSASATPLESLIAAGESLYAQTSPDGRELIRQQIRTLRDKWEHFGEELDGADQNLSLQAAMLEDFSSSQDQLSKFLRDIEGALEGCTQLKYTLPEKEAQLKLHLNSHQEILGKEDLVGTVCERAEALASATQDSSLAAFIASIQQLYERIKAKSNSIRTNLEENVATHVKFNDARQAVGRWLADARQKIAESSETTGEKGDIIKRLEALEALETEAREVGVPLTTQLVQALPPLLLSTSSAGKGALEAEVKQAESSLQDVMDSVKTACGKLKDTHAQWLVFDSDLANQAQWLKDNEQFFRSLPLSSTLEEKETALAQLVEARNNIVGHEAKVNDFVDKSHELSRVSQVERVRTLVNQLSNRFQLLSVLSKEALNRAQMAVRNHKLYATKYDSLVQDTTALEERLKSPVPEHVAKLTLEREECFKNLSGLTMLAEKLYPDTEASGREKIRTDLRNLATRLEEVGETLKGAEQKQAQHSKLMSAYRDALREVSGWLDGMEKRAAEIKPEWTSAPDARSKSIKLKVCLDEVRRMRGSLETLEEKAAELNQRNKVQGAGEFETGKERERYDRLLTSLQNNIGVHEKILESITDWDDTVGKVEDFHRQLAEQTKLYSAGAEDKVSLVEGIRRLQDLQQKLPEGVLVIDHLSGVIRSLPAELPESSTSPLKTKERNFRFEQDKLANEISEVLSSKEEALKAWNAFESGVAEMSEWIGETEAMLKSVTPKDTLEEKELDLVKFKSLAAKLRDNEHGIDKLKTEFSDFLPRSGDAQASTQLKQLDSRFQAVHKICKEIVSKAEENVKDHKRFETDATALEQDLNSLQGALLEGDWLEGGKPELEKSLAAIQSLAANKVPYQKRLNALTELGEKLFSRTGPAGIASIQEKLDQLSDLNNSLNGQLNSVERAIVDKISKFAAFEEAETQLSQKVKEFRARLSKDLELKSTLDEKRQVLNVYRSLLNDVTSQKSELLMNASGSPLFAEYESLQDSCKNEVGRWEGMVSNHSGYMTKVQENQEFMDGVGRSLALWGDAYQDRLTLQSNLHRLQNLAETLPEEGYRIEEIRNLGKKVLPETAEQGRTNIQEQIDSSQQEWEAIQATLKATLDLLQNKLAQFASFEEEREACLEFLKDAELRLHGELQPTLELKQKQLHLLQNLQAEVKARELEVDSISEKALSLQTQALPSRTSTVSDLEVTSKYQQVASRVKELTSNWNTYVNQHKNLDRLVHDADSHLKEISNKLDSCLGDTPLQDALESKLATVKELSVVKDEVYGLIQQIVEATQIVLSKTSPDGHQRINDTLEDLQTRYSALAAKIVSTKTMLEECIHHWAGFLDQLDQLDKILNACEEEIQRLSEPKPTIQEQAKQLERIKNLVEKLTSEEGEVEALQQKVDDLTPSDKKKRAVGILQRFTDVRNRLKDLQNEKENQYKFHRGYKDAHQELVMWLTRLRERLPRASASGNGVIEVESANATYAALMNKKPQGLVLLEQLQQLGSLVVAHVAPEQSSVIEAEIRAMGEALESLFREIEDEKEALGRTMTSLNQWREEYERLSDWIQQNDILLKNVKTTLPGSLEEKRQKVEDTQAVVNKLTEGQKDMEAFNTSPVTTQLLKSPLENYVSAQLQRLNARNQVQVTIGNDILKKVETTFECHNEFVKAIDGAKAWIENARELLHDSADTTSSSRKERIQETLDKIDDLIRNQETDKNLLTSALEWGEKATRNTRSDGKDAINNEMHDLQAEWDRVTKKLSGAKASLNQKLLEWADFNTSYNLAKEWISEREAKLEKVVQGGSQSKKANLRAASTIVQDIVCLEPLIETLATKGKTLQNEEPASEITTQYEKLVNSAQQLYSKQKVAVEIDQDFAHVVHEFMTWVRNSKERLGKVAEATGDLGVKISQITVLAAELPDGQGKLNAVLSKGNEACNILPEDERELVEQQVAVCAEEFDNYAESLTRTKQMLEVGLVQQKAFEQNLKQADEWLTAEEAAVRRLSAPTQRLEEKKEALEQFQVKLQEVFDWQKELDNLHLDAQELLANFSDCRVTNAVTEVSTKYNTLLALSKEIIRRLEMLYQEHQQYRSLSDELNAWIEANTEKLNSLGPLPADLGIVNAQLQLLTGMKPTLEQGQNKLRYVEELKAKVLSASPASGQEDEESGESLQELFSSLMALYEDKKLKLKGRATMLQDLQSNFEAIQSWLEEMDEKLRTIESAQAHQDMEEKRFGLEKVKGLLKEVDAHGSILDAYQAKLDAVPGLSESSKFRSIPNNAAELTQRIQFMIASLENLNEAHEKFSAKASELTNNLGKLRLRLQQLADTHGEKSLLQERAEKLAQLSNEIVPIEADVQELKDLGEKVLEEPNMASVDHVRNKIRTIEAEREALANQVELAQKELLAGVDVWNKFEDLVQKLSQLFDKCEKELDDLKNKTEEPEFKPTATDLQNAKKLQHEFASHCGLLDELNEKSEHLMSISACPRVRQEAIELQARSTAQIAGIHAVLSKLQKNVADQTELIACKEAFAEWLANAESVFTEISGFGDFEALKEKLKIGESMTSRLPEGELLLNKLHESFARVLTVISSDSQQPIKEEIALLREEFSKYSMKLQRRISELKENISRWEDFYDGLKNAQGWIQDKLDILSERKSGDVGDLKCRFDMYKALAREVAQDQTVEVERLNAEAEELSNSSNDREPIESAARLRESLRNLAELIGKLEAEATRELESSAEFRALCQDVEKWILQTSFQLMTQNSLCITNEEQTEVQIETHDTLMQEMSDYGQTIVLLNLKGEEQIRRYPTLQETVEPQLANIAESYASLMRTGNQIKARLLDSLKVFQAYEETLRSIMENLDQWEPQISATMEESVVCRGDLVGKLEKLRLLHNHVQGEKSRLNLAVQNASSAAASLSRPSSPQEALLQPIPDRELVVRSRLEDTIDQIQSNMTEVGSNMSALDEIKAKKDEMEKWAEENLLTLKNISVQPLRQRPESLEAEMKTLDGIRSDVAEKMMTLAELEIEEGGIVEVPYKPELKDLLLRTGTEAENCIQLRSDQHGRLAAFQQEISDFDKTIQLLRSGADSAERGAGVVLAEKLKIITNLVGISIPDAVEMLKKLNSNAAVVGMQFSEDQLKSLEQRFKAVSKRITNRQKILSGTTEALTQFKTDLAKCQSDLNDCAIPALDKIGYEIALVEPLHSTVRQKLKTLENTGLALTTLSRRLDALKSELEESEVRPLEEQLEKMNASQNDCLEQLRAAAQRLSEAILTRKRFKDNLDAIKLRINNFEKELVEEPHIPLSSQTVERKISDLKRFGRIALEDFDASFTDLFKQATALERDSDESDSKKLKALMGSLKNEIVNLRSQAQGQIERLENALQERKAFDAQVEKIKAETADIISRTGQDVTDYNTAKLKIQLNTYEQLMGSSQRVLDEVEAMRDLALVSQLNQPNKQQFDDQIQSLRRPLERVLADLNEKIQRVRNKEKSIAELSDLISAHEKFIEKVRTQLSELALNLKLDTLETLLGSYEELAEFVQEQRRVLDARDYANFRTSDEFQALLKTEDELLAEIEASGSKLRNLVLLQQQYSALTGDVKAFLFRFVPILGEIRLGTDPVEKKIERCDELIGPLQEAEAKLSMATDKGNQMMEEVGVEDRNTIVKELQDLRQQVHSFRADATALKAEFAHLAEEYLKAGAEMDAQIQWLHEKEGLVKSRPLLHPSNIADEIREHGALEREVTAHLINLGSTLSALEQDESLPSTLAEKVAEAKSLLNRIPLELDARAAYLTENEERREKYWTEFQKIKDWVKNAENLLQQDDVLKDYENSDNALEQLKSLFGPQNQAISKLQPLRHLLQLLLPSLGVLDQHVTSRELESLDESVSSLRNEALERQALLEKNRQTWDNYLELKEGQEELLAAILIPKELGANLPQLRSSAVQIANTISNIDKAESAFESYRSAAELLISSALPPTKAKIEGHIDAFAATLEKLKSEAAEKKGECQQIISRWEECERLWKRFEAGLRMAEEKFGQIDPYLKSQAQLEATRSLISLILQEAKALEPTHTSLVEHANYILAHLKGHTGTEIQQNSLRTKLDQLTEHHQTLIRLLEEKLQWLNSQDKFLAEVEETLERLRRQVAAIDSELETVRPGAASTSVIDKLDKERLSILQNLTQVRGKVLDKFSGLNQSVPTSIAETLLTLEIDLEKLEGKLERMRQENRNQQELKAKYDRGLETLRNWVKMSEAKLEEEMQDPLALKEIIQTLFGQIPTILDQLETWKKEGAELAEKVEDIQERAGITSDLALTEKDVLNVKSAIESRKKQVGESLDAWQRFLQLYEMVLDTIETQRKLLDSPVVVMSLPEARQKFGEFSVAVKTVAKLRHQLNQMGELYTKCGEVAPAAASKLQEKLQFIEQFKTEVETELGAKCSLLQELSDEWDRCETRVKEISAWIEKCKGQLTALPSKRKPLRDQLASRETLLADIHNQKVKLGLSLEKLEVHFKSGVGCDTGIGNQVAALESRLDEFHAEVKSLCSHLETALAEITKLQEEVQSLRNQVFSAEQHLRHIAVPGSSVDKDKWATEQSSWKEKLTSLQNSIASKSERILFLIQSASSRNTL